MASLRTSKKSRYWLACYRYWQPDATHPKGGQWRQSTQSTKVLLSEPKASALEAAKEIEQSARKALKATNHKAFFESALLRILDAVKVSPHRESSWANWSEQWLREQSGTASTVEKYAAGINRFSIYLEAKAKESLRVLEHCDLYGWYAAMKKEGLSVSTCNQHFKVVRWTLERARMHELIERNPCELVRLEEAAAHERKPFTADDIKSILGHIQKHENREWRTACLFGLYCGLRLQDAVSRRFDEIHEEGKMRVLRFVPQKKRRKGKGIALPLVGELAKLNGEGLITPRLAEMRNPSKVFARILRDAGVKVNTTEGQGVGRDLSDKTFHSWRHTVNTMLANNGVDVRLRQLVSDHDSQGINARYTHPDLEAMAKALEPLASHASI